MNTSINTLEELVRCYGSSVETLRAFAVEHCGVPADAPAQIVNDWLYSHLSHGVLTMGCHFGIWNNDGIRSAMRHSLSCCGDDFRERCAKSWSDFSANPISSASMREVHVPNWVNNAALYDGHHHGESHADVRGLGHISPEDWWFD